MDTQQQPSDKTSFREKFATRSYGLEVEPKVDAAPAYKRYGSGYSPTSETPSLRFGSTSRFGAQIARSPISEKSPTVFGVSGCTTTSIGGESATSSDNGDTITLVTRGTSPTPPSNSSFLRTRRAEMDRTLEKTIPRLKPRHTTYAVECQTDEKCIEDAKLESKISAATALTSRTPSPSLYSRNVGGKYTPRTAAYTGNRPTDLALKPASVEGDVKFDTSPTREKKLEGKDTTKIGGFSYARPTDLPLSLNDNKSNGLVSPSKLRSTSPHTLGSSSRNVKREPSIPKEPSSKQLSSNKVNSRSESTKDISHSSRTESSSVIKSASAKTPISLSRSSAKIASPDRCKLPPPSPKNEAPINVPNKDFRKSELNMNLSSSSESLNSQKTKSTEQGRLGHSPSWKSQPGLSTSKSLAKLPSSPSSPRVGQSSNTLTIPIINKPDSSESSSEESSSSESSSSSETESAVSEQERRFKINRSTASVNAGFKLGLSASKTTAQISSADEASMSLDKPPRPPSGLRINEKRLEEAKTVVVRAVGPVASVMTVNYPSSSVDESSDKEKQKGIVSELPGNVKKSTSKSSIDSEKKNYRIQHIESGERTWWMGPHDNSKSNSSSSGSKIEKSKTTNGTGCNQSAPSSPSLLNKSGSKSSLRGYHGNTDLNAPSDASEPRRAAQDNSPARISDGAKSASASESETKPPIPKLNKLKKGDSGSSSDTTGLESSKSLRKDKSKSSLYKIKRIESGERPWWLQESEENTSSGIQDMPLDVPGSKAAETQQDQPRHSYTITKIESGERAWWLGEESDEPKRQLPLRSAQPKGPKNMPLFIGRHTNIDDVLGTQAPPPAAFRTPQNSSSGLYSTIHKN